MIRIGLLLAFFVFSAFAAESVERFGVFETEFAASTQSANPYRSIIATVSITRPGGELWQIPLFWDGGNSWKLRVSPDVTGTWTYQVTSMDPGLDRKAGSFDVVPSARKGSMRVNAKAPAHFERQNGEPVWFLADTAWGYFVDSEEKKLDRAGAEHFVRARAEQGFNAIHSMLLFEQGSGNGGGPPFHDIGKEDLNSAYFQEVDRRVAYANEQGVTVGLALAWGDKGRDERYPWNRFPDVEARKRYARYIAARYSAYDVYFLISGEWHAEIRARGKGSDETVFAEMIALGEAFDSAEPHGRMIGIHPMTEHGSVREFKQAPWMSFADYQQNYHHLHDRALVSRFLRGPVVNSEYGYLLRDSNGDGRPDKSNSYSAEDMRFSSWDIAMAGAYFVTGFGTTYFAGYRDPGPFDVDAKKNDEWEFQVGLIKKFFESIDYTSLTPADEMISSDTPRGADRQSREQSPSGQFFGMLRPPASTYWALSDFANTIVVYVRGVSAPLKLELGARPGTFRLRWFNTRTGTYTPEATVEISGSRDISAPDAGDWVALLQRRK